MADFTLSLNTMERDFWGFFICDSFVTCSLNKQLEQLQQASTTLESDLRSQLDSTQQELRKAQAIISSLEQSSSDLSDQHTSSMAAAMDEQSRLQKAFDAMTDSCNMAKNLAERTQKVRHRKRNVLRVCCLTFPAFTPYLVCPPFMALSYILEDGFAVHIS